MVCLPGALNYAPVIATVLLQLFFYCAERALILNNDLLAACRLDWRVGVTRLARSHDAAAREWIGCSDWRGSLGAGGFAAGVVITFFADTKLTVGAVFHLCSQFCAGAGGG